MPPRKSARSRTPSRKSSSPARRAAAANDFIKIEWEDDGPYDCVLLQDEEGDLIPVSQRLRNSLTQPNADPMALSSRLSVSVPTHPPTLPFTPPPVPPPACVQHPVDESWHEPDLVFNAKKDTWSFLAGAELEAAKAVWEGSSGAVAPSAGYAWAAASAESFMLMSTLLVLVVGLAGQQGSVPPEVMDSLNSIMCAFLATFARYEMRHAFASNLVVVVCLLGSDYCSCVYRWLNVPVCLLHACGGLSAYRRVTLLRWRGWQQREQQQLGLIRASLWMGRVRVRVGAVGCA
jgi:hypothetical protein